MSLPWSVKSWGPWGLESCKGGPFVPFAVRGTVSLEGSPLEVPAAVCALAGRESYALAVAGGRGRGGGERGWGWGGVRATIHLASPPEGKRREVGGSELCPRGTSWLLALGSRLWPKGDAVPSSDTPVLPMPTSWPLHPHRIHGSS